MPDCDFYEREFEFAFNSEFTKRNAQSISAPSKLPGNYVESICGFDVEHRLELGGVKHSVYLQFKVPYLLTRSSKRSAIAYKYYSAPPISRTKFLFFDLYERPGVGQHSRLLRLEGTNPNVWYVAPLYVRGSEFENAYRSNEVCSQCIWKHPSAIGPVSDSGKHRVYYLDDGTEMACDSEFRHIGDSDNIREGKLFVQPELMESDLTLDNLPGLCDSVQETARLVIKDLESEPSENDEVVRRRREWELERLRGILAHVDEVDLPATTKCVTLLTKIFNVSWAVW